MRRRVGRHTSIRNFGRYLKEIVIPNLSVRVLLHCVWCCGLCITTPFFLFTSERFESEQDSVLAETKIAELGFRVRIASVFNGCRSNLIVAGWGSSDVFLWSFTSLSPTSVSFCSAIGALIGWYIQWSQLAVSPAASSTSQMRDKLEIIVGDGENGRYIF